MHIKSKCIPTAVVDTRIVIRHCHQSNTKFREPVDIGSPIKDYISSAINQIKEALPEDAEIDGIIKVELSTVLQKEKGGGIKIEVLNLGAKVSENQIQKITIPIKISSESSKAVDDAIKAEAEAKKAVAEDLRRRIQKQTKI